MLQTFANYSRFKGQPQLSKSRPATAQLDISLNLASPLSCRVTIHT